MKINFSNINNKINFCKQLKANCMILKNQKAVPCHIYELTDEDNEYFKNKKRIKQWKNSELWDSVKFSFSHRDNFDCGSIYTLEDEKENCLALARARERYGEKYKRLDLIYLETCPSAKAKGYKYTGETFINFLCNLSKKEELNILAVPFQYEDALPFYNKSHFKSHPLPKRPKNLSLEGKNMEKLIAQNEEHTGHKIDYTF